MRTILLMTILLSVCICRSEKVSAETFFEPTIGGWYGSTSHSNWYGGYGELTVWKSKDTDFGILYPGVDLLTAYSQGRVDSSGYKWDEITVGVGPALQYFLIGRADRQWQWQGKTLILYEQIDGKNSNYEMSQKSMLLNIYTEYIKRVSKEMYWGMYADGKIGLISNISSTWSGDKPSNRDTAGLNGFIQKEFDEKLDGRITLSGFYQGWDDKLGIGIMPEIRINEIGIFGVKIAEVGGDTSFTGYFRFEFGKLPKGSGTELRGGTVSSTDR